MTSLGLGLGLSKQRPLAPVFDPMNIPQMGEWFDYRTLSAVGGGNPVDAWTGRKGLYLAGASTAARPTYVADAGDGRGSLLFDGVDDNLFFELNNGDMWGPDGNYEAWFVVRATPSGASFTDLFFQSFGVQNVIFRYLPSSAFFQWNTNVSNSTNTKDIQDGAWHVIRFSKSGDARKYSVDGVEIGFSSITPDPSTWLTGTNPAWIGGVVGYWPGDFRHFASFKSALDDATAAALTTYFMKA